MLYTFDVSSIKLQLFNNSWTETVQQISLQITSVRIARKHACGYAR